MYDECYFCCLIFMTSLNYKSTSTRARGWADGEELASGRTRRNEICKAYFRVQNEKK